NPDHRPPASCPSPTRRSSDLVLLTAPQQGNGTTGQGIGLELPSVLTQPGQGHKQGTRACLAAVGDQIQDLQIARSRQLKQAGEQLALTHGGSSHQLFPPGSDGVSVEAAVGIGGTFSNLMAPAITLPKTGAATSPP